MFNTTEKKLNLHHFVKLACISCFRKTSLLLHYLISNLKKLSTSFYKSKYVQKYKNMMNSTVIKENYTTAMT